MWREAGDGDSTEVAIRASLGFGERKLEREREGRGQEGVEDVTDSLREAGSVLKRFSALYRSCSNVLKIQRLRFSLDFPFS